MAAVAPAVEQAPVRDMVEKVASQMASNADVCAQAQLRVSMPQLPDDITYRIDLTQRSSLLPDTLAPTDYLIEWSTVRGGQTMRGFSAYYSGHHFRYAGGEKIQEYHVDADATPFNPRHEPGARGGVQRNARFVDILPAFVAERLASDARSGRCRMAVHADTVVDGRHVLVIDAVSLLPGGATGRESEYVIDRATALPLRVTNENSPGSISEQTLMVSYSYADASCPDSISEPVLIDRWPDEFANMRRSTFRFEQMVGHQLPAFSLPTTTGERYTRAGAGDPLAAPTVIALLESGQAFNRQMVTDVRAAVASLPFAADIIWVYADTHVDGIESETGSSRMGEHLLMSGRGLLRDCGASMLPALVFADTNGSVQAITVGYNNDLTSDVIQKLTVISHK